MKRSVISDDETNNYFVFRKKNNASSELRKIICFSQVFNFLSKVFVD